MVKPMPDMPKLDVPPAPPRKEMNVCPHCGVVRNATTDELLAIAEARKPGITAICDDIRRQFPNWPDNRVFVVATIEQFYTRKT